MTSPLPLRTRTLAGVPDALHDYYTESDSGEFVLHIGHDPARLRLERERDRWRRLAEGHILGAAADQVVDRLAPDPAWRALIRQRVLDRLALDDDGETAPTARVVDADGKVAQTRDGRDLTLGMIGLQATDPEFHATFGRCWGQGDGSSESQQRAAGAGDRDVVLGADAGQAEFEAAWQKANEQGGQVVFSGRGSGSPERSDRSAQDVAIPAGASQFEFEAAMRESMEKGGNVVIEEAH